MRKSARNFGITLTEVLVVLAIMMLIASVSFFIAGAIRRSGQAATCATHLRSLHSALQIYRADNGNASLSAGSVSRLGLPPLWMNLTTSEPIVGELADWLCPAPKRRLEDYVPHYIYPPDIEYPWPDRPATDKRPYSIATNRFRERTPLILDINHNDHAKTPMELPRVDKRVIWIDLGGSLKSEILTKPFYPTNHPDFFSFFELD